MVLPGYCLTIGGNGRDSAGSSLAVNHLRTQEASQVLLEGVDRAGE